MITVEQIWEVMRQADLVHGSERDPLYFTLARKGWKPLDFYRELCDAVNRTFTPGSQFDGFEFAVRNGTANDLILRVNHQYPAAEYKVGHISGHKSNPIKVAPAPYTNGQFIGNNTGNLRLLVPLEAHYDENNEFKHGHSDFHENAVASYGGHAELLTLAVNAALRQVTGSQEKTVNVLIVDNDKNEAEVLEYAFEGPGYRSTYVNNLETAKKLVDTKDFDIVLCDFKLDDGKGYQLLEHMGNEQRKIPFILMSKRTEAERIKKMEKAGMTYVQPDAFLHKEGEYALGVCDLVQKTVEGFGKS